jgi:hypothetical protein
MLCRKRLVSKYFETSLPILNILQNASKFPSDVLLKKEI